MQTVRISNREIFGGPTDGVMFIALTKNVLLSQGLPCSLDMLVMSIILVYDQTPSKLITLP